MRTMPLTKPCGVRTALSDLQIASMDDKHDPEGSDKEATMATATLVKKSKAVSRPTPIPRTLRARAEALLNENYNFMDSPMFRRKNIEADLFTFEDAQEPALP